MSGWLAARSVAAGPGRLRAGTVLIARGEFSIVIAALGAASADGAELGAMAAAYVLITAVLGPLVTKFSDRLGSAVGSARSGRPPTDAEAVPSTETAA